MAMMVARQRAAHQMLAMIWENARMKRSSMARFTL
jgi:hypothetical protein